MHIDANADVEGSDRIADNFETPTGIYKTQMQHRDPWAKELKKYYEDHGALIDVYYSINSKGIRGLFASRDIEKGEVFLKIPLTMAYRCGKDVVDYKCMRRFVREDLSAGQEHIKKWLHVQPPADTFRKTVLFMIPAKATCLSHQSCQPIVREISIRYCLVTYQCDQIFEKLLCHIAKINCPDPSLKVY